MSDKKYHKVTPYAEADRSKKDQVADMFDRISGRYDFLNHFLSLGIDRRWRRVAVEALREDAPRRILDVATGTGDLALALQRSLRPDQIIGLDIADKMLDVGRQKVHKQGLEESIQFVLGDSEQMDFADDSFDACTVAFGVRNFQRPLMGLKEIYRVLAPGARLVVLEFSHPRAPILKQGYSFYFNKVLPRIGRILSSDPKAYRYLHDSVQAFPDYEDFTALLDEAGFSQTQYRPLTFGICCIYQGIKT